MFPFTYYVDCRGDLWVPCNCGCGNRGGEEIEGAAAGRAVNNAASAAGRRDAARDYDLRREYGGERICRASKAEEAMLQREMARDQMMDNILETVKRLEQLHERELNQLKAQA